MFKYFKIQKIYIKCIMKRKYCDCELIVREIYFVNRRVFFGLFVYVQVGFYFFVCFILFKILDFKDNVIVLIFFYRCNYYYVVFQKSIYM